MLREEHIVKELDSQRDVVDLVGIRVSMEPIVRPVQQGSCFVGRRSFILDEREPGYIVLVIL